MSEVLASDLFSFDDMDETSSSPTNALFPPSLSFPGLDIENSLDSYLSPGSLSPHSIDHTHPSLSPPTLGDSPRSNLSLATDEFLLNNSFGQDELDMLIFPEDVKSDFGTMDSLALPSSLAAQSTNGGSPFSNSSFDMRPPTSPLPVEFSKSLADQSVPVSNVPVNMNFGANLGQITPLAFDGILNQWRMNLAAQAPPPWMQPQVPVFPPAQPQAQSLPHAHIQPKSEQRAVLELTTVVEAQPVPVAPAKDASAPAPRRSAPNAPINAKPSSTSPPANVGKHNKTERRYRQKVQQAQADLRDSVPALRVLYGTSNDEQRANTDIRAPDGTVDGLGEVTRPNASAKATILIGARMYIELLQRRTNTLQRKVAELEAWRQQVGGSEDLNAWRSDFDRREAVIAAQLAAAAEAAANDSSDEPDSEEEEAQPTRKRARTTKKAKATEKVSTGVRAFAAFAVSFSLMPSASKLFKSSSDVVAGQTVYTGAMSRNQVITRLPLITAEHSSRLLGRALPAALVPLPHTLVDWTFRLLLALAFFTILAPILERASRKFQDKKTGAGNIVGLGKDLLQLAFGAPTEPSTEWSNLAARIVGGVANPPALVRWHVAVRLRQSSNDPYSLALHALLAPENSSSGVSWVEARSKCDPNSPLAAVLALPLDEASRSLELVPPTPAPIAAIAEQINLYHLYDLYTRFFVHLVDAVGDAKSLPPMLQNVQKSNISTELQSLGREIRTVLRGMPKHSPSHALSLVLLGLWGLFSGYSQPAVLVSALAAEEVRGEGASLSSVSAMLELLYPGSSNSYARGSASLVAANAQAIDKLAIACIGFVDLLFSSSQLNEARSRLELVEVSQRVQKEASRLRLVLTQASFVGLDDEEEEDTAAFDGARQKLVSILCSVGRRAAGRGLVRDSDSGLDDEDDW